MQRPRRRQEAELGHGDAGGVGEVTAGPEAADESGSGLPHECLPGAYNDCRKCRRLPVGCLRQLTASEALRMGHSRRLTASEAKEIPQAYSPGPRPGHLCPEMGERDTRSQTGAGWRSMRQPSGPRAFRTVLPKCYRLSAHSCPAVSASARRNEEPREATTWRGSVGSVAAQCLGWVRAS